VQILAELEYFYGQTEELQTLFMEILYKCHIPGQVHILLATNNIIHSSEGL
jgi:hypothetical protein